MDKTCSTHGVKEESCRILVRKTERRRQHTCHNTLSNGAYKLTFPEPVLRAVVLYSVCCLLSSDVTEKLNGY
jgi:hypothetical protein